MFLGLFLMSLASYTQNISISGYVYDAANNEKIISAAIYDTISKTGVVSNSFGYFNLILKANQKAHIQISFLGYKTFEKTYSLTENINLSVHLESGIQLDEVTVVANKIERESFDKTEIPKRLISTMPVFLGEANVMKTLQMLPGVKFGNEGNSAIYVRGGSPDQNLILLDDVPLYYVNHYGGIYSIFNDDAISNVSLIKGGFPARYGGRLSSVVDIRMKDGNNQKFNFSSTLGMLTSKLLLEGPIVKDKVSFMISARRSFLDLFMRAVAGENAKAVSAFYFYDINSKVNYKINDKNQLYFSFYNGQDVLFSKTKDDALANGSSGNNRANWGNSFSALRYSSNLLPKLFINFTAYQLKYNLSNKQSFNTKDNSETISNTFLSEIEDYSTKANAEIRFSRNYQMQLGGQFINHKFSPGIYSYKSNYLNSNIDTSFGGISSYSTELNYYIDNIIEIKSFLFNAGVHATRYSIKGKNYNSYDPRLSMRYLVSDKLTLSASYSQIQQYLHLLANSGIGMPTDLWVPANEKAKPENATQITSGFNYKLPYSSLVLSIEGYYKIMNNLISYKEGVSFMSDKSWEEKIETEGIGKAYGIEFMLRKDYGKLTGWLAYTWSKNLRKFENINTNKFYNYVYDKTHDCNIILSYKINDNFRFSATWTYTTGNALTLPVGKIKIKLPDGQSSYISDSYAHVYEGKNTFRLNNYHRLDIGLNYEKKKNKHINSWNFSILNLYNKMNPSYYEYQQEEDGRIKLLQISEFPIMPSLSYSIKF